MTWKPDPEKQKQCILSKDGFTFKKPKLLNEKDRQWWEKNGYGVKVLSRESDPDDNAVVHKHPRCAECGEFILPGTRPGKIWNDQDGSDVLIHKNIRCISSRMNRMKKGLLVPKHRY